MKKLKTDKLVRQLNNWKAGNKPAIYEGQTYRSIFSRSKKHNDNYKAKDSKSSWMQQHAIQCHEGQTENEMTDYKLVPLHHYTDNLGRQTDEGVRQKIMEKFQTEGKIICLNSKLDFIKPFKTHLTVQTGNMNDRPGVTEGRKRKQTDKIEKDRNKTSKRICVQTEKETDFQRHVRTKRCSTPAPDTSGLKNLDISNIIYPQDQIVDQTTPDHSNLSIISGTSEINTGKNTQTRPKRKRNDPEFGSAQPRPSVKFKDYHPDQLELG